ncbi:MAG: prepilin peptidase [Acetobacteraceae bacterium]|nr:prepilin peptidase [Pseudomonadota bacterium]
MMQEFSVITLWQFVAVAAAVVLLLIAALSDLLSRTIPDSVSIALAALGLANRALLGFSAVATSAALALLLFVLLAIVHARGGLGGGDVKLVSAAAFGLSPASLYQMLLCMSFAGGLLAVLHLSVRRLPRPARCPPGASRLRRLWTIEKWRWRRPGCLPYGVAIATGGVWALLSGTGT